MNEKDYTYKLNLRYKYRIYISNEMEGYELIKITYNENMIEDYRKKCMKCDWFIKMLVIKHDERLNLDEPYYLEEFLPNEKRLVLGENKRK